MRREQTNLIRTVIEDYLPAVVRDSELFHFAARRFWGDHITRLAEFRAKAPFLSAEEYEALYREHPQIHENGTDNSEACIRRICADAVGPSVCDVGCGLGGLLRRIRRAKDGPLELTGVDFVAHDGLDDGIRFVTAQIEDLPFPDATFDTVICTHVIEHILDYRRAIAELRRVTRRRLIVVVPREREFRYSFNPHFNFFPYPHSLLRAMHPVPEAHLCEDIGRDLYYREDRG